MNNTHRRVIENIARVFDLLEGTKRDIERVDEVLARVRPGAWEKRFVAECVDQIRKGQR